MSSFDCRDARPDDSERRTGGYSDLQIADYGIRLIQGESLDIVPADLRPFFERAQARAAEMVAARPASAPAAPPVPVLALTPHVWALLQSLGKAAGARPGEWPRWLAEAQAKDAADAAPPKPETAKPRAAHLRRLK